MGDKFALQEPFVGRAAEAICSLLWKRHLTLHLSPPAAGYNSTHLEPLSRGAEQSSCIIILHNNGCSGKQETNIEYIPERLSWGTEVKGPGGGLQGGKAEGRKVRKKTWINPFLKRGLSLAAPEERFCLTLRRWMSLSSSGCWSCRRGQEHPHHSVAVYRQRCSLPSSQGVPMANSHLAQGRRGDRAQPDATVMGLK